MLLVKTLNRSSAIHYMAEWLSDHVYDHVVRKVDSGYALEWEIDCDEDDWNNVDRYWLLEVWKKIQ